MSVHNRDTARDHHRAIDPAEGSGNNRTQERGHRKARAEAGVGESSWKRPSQFKKTTVVLDCDAAQGLAGAEPAAMLVQACEKRDRTAANDPKFEVVEEKYHFRGIGEQVITSFIKL